MAVIDIDASSQKGSVQYYIWLSFPFRLLRQQRCAGDRRSLRARLQLVDDESTSSNPVDATATPEDIAPAPIDAGEKFAPEPKRVKRVD